MIQVKVRAIMDLAIRLGGHQHTLLLAEDSDIGTLLDVFGKKHTIDFYELVRTGEEQEEITRGGRESKILLMLNGKNILFLQGLRTKLHEGDDVVFFSPVGGG